MGHDTLWQWVSAEPLSQALASKESNGDRPAVLVSVNWRARNRSADSPEQAGESRRRCPPALVEVAVVVPAKLGALGCIDPPEPDAGAVPDQVIRARRNSGQTGHGQREPENSIYFDFQDDCSPSNTGES
jgi:hypothetical protein